MRHARAQRGSRCGAEITFDGINLVGQTDLMMLMGVLSHCRALVANDSGALHLAAALGVPVVGIYGPTDERYSTPLTSSRKRAQRDRRPFPSRCSAARAFWPIVRSITAA